MPVFFKAPDNTLKSPNILTDQCWCFVTYLWHMLSFKKNQSRKSMFIKIIRDIHTTAQKVLTFGEVAVSVGEILQECLINLIVITGSQVLEVWFALIWEAVNCTCLTPVTDGHHYLNTTAWCQSIPTHKHTNWTDINW